MNRGQKTYLIAFFIWGISVILEGDVAYRMQDSHHFFVWSLNLNFSTTEQKEVEYRSFDTSIRVYMSDEEYNNVRGLMNDLLSPAIITSEDDDEQPVDFDFDDNTTLFESEDGSY